MRRLFAALLLVAVAGCGSETLAPVNTVDGSWTGTSSGYELSLALAQNDSGAVNGTVELLGRLGTLFGTTTGTFVYPELTLTINVDGFEPVTYVGEMSTTEARIDGVLNGSGFDNVQIGVKKQ
jgi:hypothetical protein